MSSEIDARDFGRLESEVNQLQSLVKELRDDMKAMRKAFDSVTGGMRVLIVISGFIGSIITLLVPPVLKRFF
jgi:hypothetical protein